MPSSQQQSSTVILPSFCFLAIFLLNRANFRFRPIKSPSSLGRHFLAICHRHSGNTLSLTLFCLLRSYSATAPRTSIRILLTISNTQVWSLKSIRVVGMSSMRTIMSFCLINHSSFCFIREQSNRFAINYLLKARVIVLLNFITSF